MDVNLKFGEHYYQSVDSSWIITVGFPLLGLLLSVLGLYLTVRYFKKGLENDRLKEERQRKNQNISHLRYAKELLKGCVESSNAHWNSIDAFITEQEADFTELAVFRRKPTNNFFRLKSMDRHGVFDAWLTLLGNTQEEIEEYQKLNDNLDFLEKVYDETIRLYDNNILIGNEHLGRIEELLEMLPDRMASAMQQIGGQLGNPDQRFKHPEWAMLDKWMKTKNTLYEQSPPLRQVHDEFIYPFLEELVKDYRWSFFTDELTSICRDIRVRKNKVRLQTVYLIRELNKFRTPSEERIDMVNDGIERIGKTIG